MARASRSFVWLALTALLVGAAVAEPIAQPPVGATLTAQDDFTFAHWVGPDALATNGTLVNATPSTLWFAFLAPNPADSGNTTTDNATTDNATANATTPQPAPITGYVAYVNVTTEFGPASFVLDNAADAPEWDAASAPLTAIAAVNTTSSYTFSIDVLEVRDANATLVSTSSGSGTFSIVVPYVAPAPVEPGLPLGLIIGAAAAIVVVGGGATLAVRRKQAAERATMNRTATRRSQALREETVEKKLAKVGKLETSKREADVVQAQEIRQQVEVEIRQEEKQREVRRERQILEAKKTDVLKTMDLLKKRHEMGGITEHQYKTMLAKRQVDLDKIEADIAQMDAEDAAGAAA